MAKTDINVNEIISTYVTLDTEAPAVEMLVTRPGGGKAYRISVPLPEYLSAVEHVGKQIKGRAKAYHNQEMEFARVVSAPER